MKDEHVEEALNVVVAYGPKEGIQICCMGTVRQRADDGTTWWIDVYTGAADPLPQMFRAEDILGLASLGMKPHSLS
jgi:hypothetical protein